MEFTGEFETHYTIHLDPTTPDLEALRAWGAEHGLKCLHILLSRGDSASQPMLTGRGQGTLSGERARAEEIAKSLQATGFPVTRVKIEAAPWNEDVPQSLDEARNHPPDRHFEHHIKLLLEPDANIALLMAVAVGHDAHLSRNALKQREDGRRERFVTQRCFGVGRDQAKRRLDALFAALDALGQTVVDIEEEFVVYDSNIELDRGWLNHTSKDTSEIGHTPFPSDAEEIEAVFAIDMVSEDTEVFPIEDDEPFIADYAPKLRACQSQITHHLLEVVSQSLWFEQLVLTGSHMMRSWFGERARDPGDVDWVVRPKKLRGSDYEVEQMMEEMINIVRKSPDVNGIGVVGKNIEVRHISIYGQETGKRVIFPWGSSCGMRGTVQMDFCFGTELNHGIRPFLMPLVSGNVLPVLAVTKQELLLWKLYWLHQDDLTRKSRGKDLYDATLLAEDTYIPYSLLEKVIPELASDSDMPLEWEVEWDEFASRTRQVYGEAFDWQQRLWTALAPTFVEQKAVSSKSKFDT